MSSLRNLAPVESPAARWEADAASSDDIAIYAIKADGSTMSEVSR